MCLMHPQIAGMLHYHFIPVCLADSSIGESAGRCEKCDDIINYGLDAFASNKTLTPIGIAKDGHIVYGPYSDSG